MKLTEKNAKYIVVMRAFHGGRAISYHVSREAAERAARRLTSPTCSCGGCAAVVTAAEYDKLPAYSPDMHYWRLCR